MGFVMLTVAKPTAFSVIVKLVKAWQPVWLSVTVIGKIPAPKSVRVALLPHEYV